MPKEPYMNLWWHLNLPSTLQVVPSNSNKNKLTSSYTSRTATAREDDKSETGDKKEVTDNPGITTTNDDQLLTLIEW